jgi:hypothetical protein
VARSNHQRKGIYLSDFNVSAPIIGGPPTTTLRTDVNAVDMYRLQNSCKGEGYIHAPPLPVHMKSPQHGAERSCESYAVQTSDKAGLCRRPARLVVTRASFSLTSAGSRARKQSMMGW